MSAGETLAHYRSVAGAWRALPALAFAAGMAGLSVTITRPILVAIAESYRLPVALAGQMMTVAAVAGMVGTLGLSPLLDRVGRRRAILATLAMMTIAGLASSVAPTFALLCVCYAPVGLGGFMLLALVLAATADLRPGPRLAPALGWIAVGNIAISMVGLPLLAASAQRSGWQSAFLWYALAALVAAGSILWALPGTPAALPSRRIRYRDVLAHLVRAGGLSNVLWTVAFASACSYGSSTFLGALAVQRLGTSTALTGILLGLFSMGSALGGFTIGRIVHRRHARRAAVAAGLSGTATLLVYLAGYRLASFVALGFVNAIAVGAQSVLLNTALLEGAMDERGTVAGLRSLMECVGAIAGPALAGLAVASGGYAAAGGLFAVLALLAATAASMYRRPVRVGMPRAEVPNGD